MNSNALMDRIAHATRLPLALGALALAAPLLYATNALADDHCTAQDGTEVTISDPTSCEFVASSSCSTQCTTSAFTTECQAQCSASASTDGGTSTASASCETSCQSSLMTDCTTQCSDPHGALFCNGQFINVSAISQCTFTISASGTVTASGTAKCSVSPGMRTSGGAPLGLAIVAGLGVLVARRRRRQG